MSTAPNDYDPNRQGNDPTRRGDYDPSRDLRDLRDPNRRAYPDPNRQGPYPPQWKGQPEDQTSPPNTYPVREHRPVIITPRYLANILFSTHRLPILLPSSTTALTIHRRRRNTRRLHTIPRRRRNTLRPPA